ACAEQRGVVIHKAAHARPFRVLPLLCWAPRRDRLDDVVIASAATDVALELLPDRRLIRFAKAARDVERDHHHSRGAVAALKRMVLPKGRLHGMEWLARRGNGLGGGVWRPLAPQRKNARRRSPPAHDMSD